MWQLGLFLSVIGLYWACAFSDVSVPLTIPRTPRVLPVTLPNDFDERHLACLRCTMCCGGIYSSIHYLDPHPVPDAPDACSRALSMGLDLPSRTLVEILPEAIKKAEGPEDQLAIDAYIRERIQMANQGQLVKELADLVHSVAPSYALALEMNGIPADTIWNAAKTHACVRRALNHQSPLDLWNSISMWMITNETRRVSMNSVVGVIAEQWHFQLDPPLPRKWIELLDRLPWTVWDKYVVLPHKIPNYGLIEQVNKVFFHPLHHILVEENDFPRGRLFHEMMEIVHHP